MTKTGLWFRRREPNQLSPVANTVINALFFLYAAACVLPVLIIFSISISSEESVMRFGYGLIPREFSLESYGLIFKDGITIARAYGVTMFTTIVGTAICVVSVCLYAYPLSRTTFKFRKFFMFFVFLTMLFSGGMVASFVINTMLLNLKNNIWIMILPMGFNAFWVMVMRTFYKTQIPESLIESAKIDGAGEWYTLIRIVLPLSLPGIATVALFSTIGIWNDFFLNLLYIQEPSMYNLQRLIQQTLASITTLREIAFKIGSSGGTIDLSKLPNETFRMAICIVTIGPIILAYPFFQKYFIRGLTIGAIKE
jgi:putative aldouronate transport system permease protein